MPACTGPSTVVHDAAVAEYDFGPQHPMSPLRVDLTMRLADQLGVLAHDDADPGLKVVTAPMASLELLATVHSESLIEAVQRVSFTGRADLAHGIGTEDNPTFPAMHRASAHVVGATVEAARQVWEGESQHSASIIGGLHHAMPDKVSGFCVYNDVAVAIQWLLDHGAERVAYVDVDAHHGDGVEKIFWDDPRVLTISLHETGQMLFPGTGHPADLGGRDAEGSAVNVALPPGTADAGWLRAFHAVVPDLLKEFDPQILVSQHGCDSHMSDPLTHLMLSVDGQRAAHAAVHQLAHDHAGGKWVATGGGGYSIGSVVPRTWTHLLAEVAGRPIDPETPTPLEWREHVERLLGETGPFLMTDGRTPAYRDWRDGYDPEAWLDRAINATRTAAFPLHGIDPTP
ncbi:acetoin utilization protein AcuC [Nocardioides yefusunii]|uniref:Acetoin utilization protein AcuC n=1 Tax=Nocardioides yefusunii TaxID=2500546 RepID=A0ABW1R1M4_9ACTN|nr:acetoin utilization protein AcuC [Nocardioides yefusunii]